VKRAQREDIDLHRRLWFTRTAKGGINTAILLNDEMLAAWQLFIGASGRVRRPQLLEDAEAERLAAAHPPEQPAALDGDCDPRRRRRPRGRAGSTRPPSIVTTREFYLHALPKRQEKVSQVLAGRFGAAMFAERRPIALTPAQKRRRERAAVRRHER
jgi:hypothetical protein